MKNTLTILLLCSSFFSFSQGSGNCLDFDGTNDYVQLTANNAQNPGKYFTVEAWINADSWQSNIWQGTIVSKDQWSSISEGWVIRCGNNGRLSFNLALNNNNQWYEIQSSQVMTTNKWYHVAGTYDGSVMRLYLNGKQIGTTNQTGTITTTTSPVKIGNISMTGQSRYFDGEIDDVRIWDTVVSEANLREYMCQKIDVNHPNAANLVGYYKLDAGSGNTHQDNGPLSLSATNFGATWSTSGAAIGDKSTYIQPSSWSGVNLKFGHVDGDSLNISSVSGNPQGMHIYYVDTVPNIQNPPLGVASLYTERYYGVFPTSGSNVSFTAAYHYNGFPGINSQSDLNYNHRSDNADTTWSGLTTTLDTIAQVITRTSATKGEFILGDNDNLSDFDLNSPANSSSIAISGQSTQTIDFDWFSSKLASGAPAKYRWQIDHDTANFSSPLGNKASNSSGNDTVASVTYQEIANIMNAQGLEYGDVWSAKWKAKAEAGPLSEDANQVFDIDITRGILSSDIIYAFFCDQPDGDTLHVIKAGSDDNPFNWRPATSTAGSDISYTVEIAFGTGFFTNVLGSFPADNSGKDTVANISDDQLATMMENVPLPQRKYYEFKWRVKAEIGSLVSYSNDSNYIYLYWESFIGVPEHRDQIDFELFPNPASSEINIRFKDPLKGKPTLEILNPEGKRIQSIDLNTETNQKVVIPKNIQPGIYLVRITGDDGVLTRRILIE